MLCQNKLVNFSGRRCNYTHSSVPETIHMKQQHLKICLVGIVLHVGALLSRACLGSVSSVLAKVSIAVGTSTEKEHVLRGFDVFLFAFPGFKDALLKGASERESERPTQEVSNLSSQQIFTGYHGRYPSPGWFKALRLIVASSSD